MGKIKLEDVNGIPNYNFDIPIDEFDKAIKYSWIKFFISYFFHTVFFLLAIESIYICIAYILFKIFYSHYVTNFIFFKLSSRKIEKSYLYYHISRQDFELFDLETLKDKYDMTSKCGTNKKLGNELKYTQNISHFLTIILVCIPEIVYFMNLL